VRGGEQLLKNDLPSRGIFRNSGIANTRFGLRFCQLIVPGGIDRREITRSSNALVKRETARLLELTSFFPVLIYFGLVTFYVRRRISKKR